MDEVQSKKGREILISRGHGKTGEAAKPSSVFISGGEVSQMGKGRVVAVGRRPLWARRRWMEAAEGLPRLRAGAVTARVRRASMEN